MSFRPRSLIAMSLASIVAMVPRKEGEGGDRKAIGDLLGRANAARSRWFSGGIRHHEGNHTHQKIAKSRRQRAMVKASRRRNRA